MEGGTGVYILGVQIGAWNTRKGKTRRRQNSGKGSEVREDGEWNVRTIYIWR